MSHRWVRWLVAVFATLIAVAATPGIAAAKPKSAGLDLRPIVFVHGQFGSAQQFQTQAMRFTSNGYPQDLLFAHEYDTSVSTNDLHALDAFVDDVLARTGHDQIYAIGHSRGTSVLTSYLSGDDGLDGSAKVAKYVNIDGRTMPDLPGGVPTIGIWGEWNSAGSGFNRIGDTDAQIGPDPAMNFHFPGKSHTEVATSPEAFAHMFAFLAGRAPGTTAVVPQSPGKTHIAGRVVLFPQNEGYDGATVELWKVRPETGRRIGSRPRAVFTVDETGAFGPVRLHGRKHHELAVVHPTGEVHHFYFEPFTRSDHFVRLNTSRPGEGLAAVIPDSDATTNMNILRMRELWGDQGAASDSLTVDGAEVVTPATSPRSGVNLALFAYDDGLDGVTDLGKGELSPFNLLPFLTAVDVFVPSSLTGPRPVAVTMRSRGAPGGVTINVPNWPSSSHGVTVQFQDD